MYLCIKYLYRRKCTATAVGFKFFTPMTLLSSNTVILKISAASNDCYLTLIFKVTAMTVPPASVTAMSPRLASSLKALTMTAMTLPYGAVC